LENINRKRMMKRMEKWNDFRRRKEKAIHEFVQAKKIYVQKVKWNWLFLIRCVYTKQHANFLKKVEAKRV